MYHYLHGPDDCGVYCISRGEAGVTPYWTGVEKCDNYEGNGVLPRTGSDEPVDSFVRTTGSDEPVDSVVHTTGSDEPVASVVHTTGSDELADSVVCTPGPAEPVNDVMPCWTGGEEYDDYGGNVVLPRNGSDELVNSVVCNTGSDEPVDSVAVTSSADTVSIVTTGLAFQDKCDVPSGSIMMTIVMMDIMMRTRTILTILIWGILTITPMCMAL